MYARYDRQRAATSRKNREAVVAFGVQSRHQGLEEQIGIGLQVDS
jgi:hypothetical protein